MRAQACLSAARTSSTATCIVSGASCFQRMCPPASITKMEWPSMSPMSMPPGIRKTPKAEPSAWSRSCRMGKPSRNWSTSDFDFSTGSTRVEPVEKSKSLVDQLRLGFPILQDRDHALGSAFGVFRIPGGMDMGDMDGHSIFVIDAGGHIRWKQLAPDTMHVAVDDVLAAL